MSGAVAAAVAVGGPLMVTDFVDALAVTARTYAEAMPNYAVIGRAMVAGVGTRALLALFAVAALGSAMRGRSADTAFGTFTTLALLAAPVVWSQHLALALVPLAVLLRRVWVDGHIARPGGVGSVGRVAVATRSGRRLPERAAGAVFGNRGGVPGCTRGVTRPMGVALLDSDVAPEANHRLRSAGCSPVTVTPHRRPCSHPPCRS